MQRMYVGRCKEEDFMRRRKSFLPVICIIMAICFLFFFQSGAEAAGSDFYKEYSLEEYDIEDGKIKLDAKCKMTIFVDCPYEEPDEDDDYQDDEDDGYWDDEDDDYQDDEDDGYWDDEDDDYQDDEDDGYWDDDYQGDEDGDYWDDEDDGYWDDEDGDYWDDEDDGYWDDEDDDYWDDEDDWDEPGEVYIVLQDADGEEVFEEYIDSYGVSKYSVTLPAGKYWLYIDADLECTVSLSGQYIPELSPKKTTLEAGKSKALRLTGAGKKVSWKSSDESVATVSKKGVVKAKKAGKATITATCGKKKLKCKVTVKVSYNELSKNMKTFAKKNKSFKYENVKNVYGGKKCRLYGKMISGKSFSKTDGFITMAQPCIELRKLGQKTDLHFRMFLRLMKISHGNVTVSTTGAQLVTSNKKLGLKFDSGISDIYFDKETGYMVGDRSEEATVFKMNGKSLKQFESMLNQSSLMVRTKNYDGSVFQAKVDAGARKVWKKLLKQYQTLLNKF